MDLKIVFFPNLPRNYRWPRTEECPISLHSKNDIEDICQLLGQLTERKFDLDDSRIRRIQKTSEWLVVRDQDEREKNRNGRIIGSAMLVPIEATIDRFGLVEDVVIDKDYRGKGIGRLLMERVIQHAIEMRLAFVELTSHPKREEANRLYPKLGFELRETNYYRLMLGKG